MEVNAQTAEPLRSAIDTLDEPALIEFGASWCGHCQSARPLIAAALAGHPQLRHIKVEDGPGRRLGRSFGVKLWPTLIFMRHGQEQARLVRPADADAIIQALALISAPDDRQTGSAA